MSWDALPEDFRIFLTYCRTSGRSPASFWSRSVKPMMAVRIVLKSWAIPPARVPTASSLLGMPELFLQERLFTLALAQGIDETVEGIRNLSHLVTGLHRNLPEFPLDAEGRHAGCKSFERGGHALGDPVGEQGTDQDDSRAE